MEKRAAIMKIIGLVVSNFAIRIKNAKSKIKGAIKKTVVVRKRSRTIRRLVPSNGKNLPICMKISVARIFCPFRARKYIPSNPVTSAGNIKNTVKIDTRKRIRTLPIKAPK
jgi:hypothetical protein